MKEEILNNLAGLIEYVKQGADFVKEQAPLYVQEMINYGIWTSVFEILFSASLESTKIDPIKEKIDNAIAAPPFIQKSFLFPQFLPCIRISGDCRCSVLLPCQHRHQTKQNFLSTYAEAEQPIAGRNDSRVPSRALWR